MVLNNIKKWYYICCTAYQASLNLAFKLSSSHPFACATEITLILYHCNLQAQYLYNTFVNKNDTTLNISQFNTESKNQIQRCEEDFKATKTQVLQLDNDVAAKMVALCSAWITVCSELKDVSNLRSLEKRTKINMCEAYYDEGSNRMPVAGLNTAGPQYQLDL